MTTKTVAETLKEAGDLIALPGRWTKRAIARDRYNLAVSPHSVYAYSFCAIGT